jgi:hypothetical protein
MLRHLAGATTRFTRHTEPATHIKSIQKYAQIGANRMCLRTVCTGRSTVHLALSIKTLELTIERYQLTPLFRKIFEAKQLVPFLYL